MLTNLNCLLVESKLLVPKLATNSPKGDAVHVIVTDSSSQDPSASITEDKAEQATSMHLYFPCGIIRGALSNVGIPSAVSADMSNLPA
ncbi:hypothetical protein MKX01_026653, partial [Papaver californicum]